VIYVRSVRTPSPSIAKAQFVAPEKKFTRAVTDESVCPVLVEEEGRLVVADISPVGKL